MKEQRVKGAYMESMANLNNMFLNEKLEKLEYAADQDQMNSRSKAGLEQYMNKSMERGDHKNETLEKKQ